MGFLPYKLKCGLYLLIYSSKSRLTGTIMKKQKYQIKIDYWSFCKTEDVACIVN